MIPGANDCKMPNTLTLSSLPLFPLGTVLFPDGLLPLRIFEVRYLDMIGKCHKAGAPFGVVSLSHGNEVRRPGMTEEFASIGTLAAIEEFTSPQPGLLLIRCRGTTRFRIDRREQLRHGLWVADVTQIGNDQPVPVPTDLQPTANALQRLIQTMKDSDVPAEDLPMQPPWQLDDCGWVANRWSELLPLPIEAKQRLMSLDNPLVRLELVSDALGKFGIGTANPTDGF